MPPAQETVRSRSHPLVRRLRALRESSRTGDLCLIERRGPGTAPIMFDGAGAMLAETVGFGDGGVPQPP